MKKHLSRKRLSPLDPTAKTLAKLEWNYGDKDEVALQTLENRIADTGRNGGLITYSDLVHGVIFRLANVNGGKPYQIDVEEWSGLDRAIIGDFLGLISTRSYLNASFMASALVVNQSEHRPSSHFFQWMRDLDVLSDLSEHTILAFWIEQVNKAHTWYRNH